MDIKSSLANVLENGKNSPTMHPEWPVSTMTDILGPIEPGTLTVVAGRPGTGKTSLVNAVAITCIRQMARNINIFSLDMSVPSCVRRILSAMSRVDIDRLTGLDLNQDEMDALSIAMEDMRSPTISHFDYHACFAKDVANAADCTPLIIIDSLQLMRISPDQTREIMPSDIHYHASMIMRDLKDIAVKCKVPIIVTSNVNRTADQRPNKRPMLTDLRSERAIEDYADNIIMLHREDCFGEGSPDSGIVEARIYKNANGPTGVVEMSFNPRCFNFKENIAQ